MRMALNIFSNPFLTKNETGAVMMNIITNNGENASANKNLFAILPAISAGGTTSTQA